MSRRNWVLAGMLALFLLVLAGLLAQPRGSTSPQEPFPEVSPTGGGASTPLAESAPLVDALPDPALGGQLVFDSPEGNLWTMPLALEAAPTPLPKPSSFGLAFQPVWSPDGERVAFGYIAPPEQGQPAQGAAIWVLEVATGQARPLYQAEDGGQSSFRDPAWAGDGQAIWATHQTPHFDPAGTFQGMASRVVRIPVDGGEPVPVTEGRAPAPSPDGTRLAYLVTDPETGKDELWLAQADGSQPRRLVAGLFDQLLAPRFSPDGETVAFAASGQPPQSRAPAPGGGLGSWTALLAPRPVQAHGLFTADIWLVQVDGGPPRRLTAIYEDHPTPAWSRDGRWIVFGGIKGLYLVEVASGRVVRLSDGAIDGQLDWHE